MLGSRETAGRQAGTPWARLAAGLCDLALLASVDVVVVGLTLRLAGLDLESFDLLPAPPLVAFLLLLDVGYVIALTAAGGQTVGKMAFDLRVTDEDGQPVSASTAVARGLYAVLSVLLCGVGIIWMFVDSERRAVHDRLSRTRVLSV